LSMYPYVSHFLDTPKMKSLNRLNLQAPSDVRIHFFSRSTLLEKQDGSHEPECIHVSEDVQVH